MYHTTGFSRDEIVELCARVSDVVTRSESRPTWPPILGLYKSVTVTLTYLHRNHVAGRAGRILRCLTVHDLPRAITVLTPLLVLVTAGLVPTAEDLSPTEQYNLDGTLVPCLSWHAHPELYSGKHHTTGLNLQVACTLRGDLAWVSDPVDRRRHDSAAMTLSGVLDTMNPRNWIGDRGYVGHNMVTPIKKRPTATSPNGRTTSTPPSTHPLENRTNHRPPQNVADTPHRLPQTPQNLPRHHRRRHRPTILPSQLNKPPSPLSLVFLERAS